MKAITLSAALLLFLIGGVMFAADEKPHDAKSLYHVVSLKFKDGASQEQIHEVEEAFAALKSKVPGVRTLHYGTNVSPEHLNKGYTHCFVLTFDSQKDRDAYLVDPAHKAFGKTLGPVMGDVMVIDFWGKE